MPNLETWHENGQKVENVEDELFPLRPRKPDINKKSRFVTPLLLGLLKVPINKRIYKATHFLKVSYFQEDCDSTSKEHNFSN